MQAFTRIIDGLGDPPTPEPAPTSLPPLPPVVLVDSVPPPPTPTPTPISSSTKTNATRRFAEYKVDGILCPTHIPTLSELGFDEKDPCLMAKQQPASASASASASPFPGGETSALRRLSDYITDRNAAWVCGFEKPKTSPAAWPNTSTTVLSPYLMHGCLSSRLFHEELVRIYRAAKGKHSHPPVSLRGQLLWRDFFHMCAHGVPNFDRMEGNPICRQIDWDTDGAAEERLAAWEEGRTGFPWIDAIMTQVRQKVSHTSKRE